MRNSRAFTLIETVVYIGLFAVILSAGTLAADSLLRASAHSGVRTTVQDEQRFVLQKIAWALSSASSTVPASGTTSTLTIERYDGLDMSFRLYNGTVEVRENAGSYVPLTTANVSIPAFVFTIQDGIVTASVTIGSSTASLSRHIRH